MWEWNVFTSYSAISTSSGLCEFLNENNIKDFKIIRSERDYLEIVYLKEDKDEPT